MAMLMKRIFMSPLIFKSGLRQFLYKNDSDEFMHHTFNDIIVGWAFVGEFLKIEHWRISKDRA